LEYVGRRKNDTTARKYVEKKIVDSYFISQSDSKSSPEKPENITTKHLKQLHGQRLHTMRKT